MNTKKDDCYDADTAEAAAELWNVLASWEGEDADAQKVIERAFRKYAAERISKQPRRRSFAGSDIVFGPRRHDSHK